MSNEKEKDNLNESIRSLQTQLETKDKTMLMLGIRSASMDGKDRKECLFQPDDQFKVFFWDTFMSIILMATLFLTPFNLAFSDELEEV